MSILKFKKKFFWRKFIVCLMVGVGVVIGVIYFICLLWWCFIVGFVNFVEFFYNGSIDEFCLWFEVMVDNEVIFNLFKVEMG